MKKPESIPVELPDSLRDQFRKLQSRLFMVDTVITMSGVLLGAFLAFNVFFVTDLAAEMPKVVRLALFGLMAGTIFIFVRFWLRHWVYNKRDTRDLSNIVQKKHDRLGDRLLGIVELADPDMAPAYASEGLRKAAIKQVSEEALKHDFKSVVAMRKPMIYLVLALGVASLAILPATW
ncbi:MAG: hypothetical protein CMO64_01220, partial [Verrucomicrobiales bacterium]|nr:hypothetical protein [Verrucomicrobiales bacterium]